MFGLIALICASPFDAVAVSTKDALATVPVPGLREAFHDPRTGWTAMVDLPFHGVARCVQAPASSVVCTRLGAHEETVEFPALARFFERITVPNDTTVSIELGRLPEAHALISSSNREAGEHRLVLMRDELVVTEPLPRVDAPGGSTSPVIERLRWPFLVLAYSESGNGNNASGSVSYRLVQLVEEGTRVAIGSVLELGGGEWGRAVTDEGLLQSSRVDLACPTLESPIITTRRVCEGDLDPRSGRSFDALCRPTTPCRRARDEHSPRIGRWTIRARSLEPLTTSARHDDGAVRVTEVAGVRESRLSRLELTNTSSAPQDVSNATLSAPGDDDGWVLGACVLRPGEVVVVTRDRASTDCELLGPEELLTPPTLVFRRGARVLQRLDLSRADEEEATFDEAPSWQVDSAGRGCVAPPSLGKKNTSCPLTRRGT